MDEVQARNLLTRLWVEHRNAVAAFAYRRAPRELVDDVVAETYLVAWRRISDVPRDARPWLLAVARNVLSTQRRTGGRRQALSIRAAIEPLEPPTSAEDVVIDRANLTRAWQLLSDTEREVLAMAGWERLTAQQAARVLGCSRTAFSVRLSRARRHLAKLMLEPSTAAGSRFVAERDVATRRSSP